jgi:ribonuclease HI
MVGLDDQHVYTDASFYTDTRSSGVGVVYAHPPKPVLMAMTQEPNINYAELFAVFLGVLFSSPWKSLVVHTDSSFCIDVLARDLGPHDFNTFQRFKGHFFSGRDVLACCTKYLVAVRRRLFAPTRFVKIKAHSGNPWHNHADRLARMAARGRCYKYRLPRLLPHTCPREAILEFLRSCDIDVRHTVLACLPGYSRKA